MTTKMRYYNATGREFLTKAHAYLAEDDLLQASEKGWGAAAQMVKSVAEAGGWPHNGHHELWRAVNLIVDQTGDRDIRTAFAAAAALHTNFYEGWLPPRDRRGLPLPGRPTGIEVGGSFLLAVAVRSQPSGPVAASTTSTRVSSRRRFSAS